MLAAESARIHGKLVLVEEDIRLHYGPYHTRYGRAGNPQESITLLRRNFAQFVTHGQGAWWMDRLIADDPALFSELKQFDELGTFALHTNRSSVAEIAVLLDDESFYYGTVKNNLDVPLIFQQKLQGLSRLGAPYDVCMLNDFIEGRLRPYKLYIFLNAFRLNDARREALNHQLRRDGRVAVWLYAPGYIKNDLSIEYMTELTGMKFAMSKNPWSVSMHILDFTHPITADIPQDLFWGSDTLISPVFYLEDADVRVLGQVVHSEGRCVPGMGVKVFKDWTSIFISAPDVPAPVLRGIARFAKVHLYNAQGDVLYASRDLLGVHTVSGGDRIFRLPRKVQVVYDLFEKRVIAHNTDNFQVTLSPVSTVLYYTGNKKLLSALEKESK